MKKAIIKGGTIDSKVHYTIVAYTSLPEVLNASGYILRHYS